METAPRTFNEQFERIVRRFPNRTAFRLKTPTGYTTVTYIEAYRQARGVALGLLSANLTTGSRVAIVSENRPEWVVAYLGIYLAGMVAVPLDTQISAEEWRRLVDDAEAQIIFASGLLIARLAEAVQGATPSRRLISFDPLTTPLSGPLSGDDAVGENIASFIERASTSPDVPALPECQPDDLATIIYTSGTTGAPKGVMLTHANIVGELQAVFSALYVDENDALLCLLPLQHVLASIINVLVPLYKGAQVVFADTLKRAEILQALKEAGITILATVPQFFYLFHDRIEQELSGRPAIARKAFKGLLRLNRASLRFPGFNLGKILFGKVHSSFGDRLRLFVSGGSAFDRRVAQDFHDMGFTIVQGYGLTETTGACTVTRVENNVIGSVGPPVPGAEVKIAAPDATGTGEILIRGPMVMKGYYRNPDETEAALKDGWFHSGDLGRFDPKGNLFVTGRQKEVIVLANGKNIYPDELETHYLQSPYIKEIAVIGVSDQQERGERLHAVVVPDFDYLQSKKIANAREALRDRIAALSNQLPKYKRLMSYQIQGEPLPRTTTRKIKRVELKRLVESGELRASEAAPEAASARDAAGEALLSSAVGQEVIHSLRDSYHRDLQIEPNMNLELDLGFDSMEKVELLVSLEQALGLQLPDGFGAEVLTIRDLILKLEEQAGVAAPSGETGRQSWSKILAEESLVRDDSARVRLAGTPAAFLKHLLLRAAYHLVFRTLLRLEVKGIEQLPKQGPYLICPNHQSYLDGFILSAVLPYRVFRNTFFVGYSPLFSGRFTGWAARFMNIVPVDPDAHLLRAMKAGANGLREGRILCIFPEGGRSFDDDLQSFKKGAAILSREVGAPMVPVAIDGTHRVWGRDSMRIRLGRVRVEFGAPMFPSQGDAADPYQADTDALRTSIASLLGV